MSNYESMLRIFQEIRLHPWIVEHKLFINSQLASLEVTDPSAAANFRKQYDEKMTKYVAEHPEEFPVVVPVKKQEVKPEEEPVSDPSADVPKKRGRKPSVK